MNPDQSGRISRPSGRHGKGGRRLARPEERLRLALNMAFAFGAAVLIWAGVGARLSTQIVINVPIELVAPEGLACRLRRRGGGGGDGGVVRGEGERECEVAAIARIELRLAHALLAQQQVPHRAVELRRRDGGTRVLDGSKGDLGERELDASDIVVHGKPVRVAHLG